MNDLVITDSSLADRFIPKRKRLDLAYGVDENDFTLNLPLADDLEVGEYFYFEGTECGGIVDRRDIDHTSGAASMTYYGRSWQGILSHSIICPNSGSAYLPYSGDLHSIFATIITRQGLGSVFVAASGLSGFTASGNFDRYTDVYTAFKKLCKSVGAKLVIRKTAAHTVELSAVARRVVNLDSDKYRLKIGEGRYTNHLVCLGSGELASRVVVHLYMDGSGNVSQSKTFSGVAEIAETYDYNNADRAELIERGTEKLNELFGDACELTLSENLGLEIGDVVRAASVDKDIVIEATVEKVIVEIENNVETVSYEVGNLTKRGG